MALLLFASSTSAELVLFTTGEVQKVESFEVSGERVVLRLPVGGWLTVPLSRVERILDDEIAPETELAEAPVAPEVYWREGQATPGGVWGELVYDWARHYGLNPELVGAMVEVESSGRSEAVSPKGARGLLQVMPATAERFGVSPSELFRPDRNLVAALTYLRWLADRFDGDPVLVLAAYNAGERSVDRYDGVPPYRETREYLTRIFGRLGFPVTERASGS